MVAELPEHGDLSDIGHEYLILLLGYGVRVRSAKPITIPNRSESDIAAD